MVGPMPPHMLGARSFMMTTSTTIYGVSNDLHSLLRLCTGERVFKIRDRDKRVFFVSTMFRSLYHDLASIKNSKHGYCRYHLSTRYDLLTAK